MSPVALADRLRSHGGTFLRFIAVGGATAAIYTLILVLLAEVFDVAPPLAVAVAYPMAIAFNYLAHYRWTYRTNRPHRSSGRRYLIFAGVIFGVNVAATAVLPELLGVGYGVVQILLLGAITVASFVSQLKWIFSSPGERRQP